MEFLDVLPFLFFIFIGAILLAHIVIDLKFWILPDELNFLLAVIMIALHAVLGFSILSPLQMFLGALVGAGFLLAVRAWGNQKYQTESLGLGDVKLLAAAGLGLGAFGTIIAITAGSFFGLIHGLTIGMIEAKKTGKKFDARGMKFPAGPGFCMGIIFALYGLFQGWWG